MKRALTCVAAAGALALAMCFPVVASAGHGLGMGMVTGTVGMMMMIGIMTGLGGEAMVVAGAAGIQGMECMSPQAMATTLTPIAVTPQVMAGIRARMTTAIRPLSCWPMCAADPEELANPPAPAPDPIWTGRHSLAYSRAWRSATSSWPQRDK
jgi:hypothetical protein